ncbi:chemotaxis protein CheW [Colwellia sp. 1_MG-2023]|uniref:chemotaxis protein CheW n=1 Tax=Colwellia sp. 1_MG-2023 TaxID=3062649 RepID=UPI0026E11FC1|nr:chemotaxis protein CheW [Colwellia sp. 1_MG-2023]MDO6444346.1 chemotaxis protein CheW [Colwellia sp. 1_MG-2023]
MKKSLAASQKLMQNYLSELMTEDEELSIKPESEAITQSLEKEKLDKLLQQASVAKTIDNSKLDVITSVKSENKVIEPPQAKIADKVVPEVEVKAEVEAETQIQTKKSLAEFKIDPDKNYRKGSFQAMFFDVAGLIVAVPLIELGGIHNVDKINSLMGKPDWFKGVMLHREEKINVVDTALWVMPEKCNQTLKDSLNYQYIIMLNNSHWGLMAENLIDTVTLEHEDVKWLEGATKRPWLAGLVKERMCALLDVDALIHMLEEGANINQSTH